MINECSRTELLLGADGMKKLKNARIAVFGIGGVGGYAVEALARSGVGALDLIDKDEISLTNINRQIIATHSTVGMPKVEAAAQRVRDINPDCTVRTYRMFYVPDTAEQFDFARYDYVIDAIDTVKGKRSGGGKVLLTMNMNDTGFMPIFLLPNATQESVLAVFDHLTNLLGLATFRKLFPVFLTDNGVEFKDPDRLEYTPNGCPRTKIFYCDPQASWRKPQNHTLIRRIIPKFTDLNSFTTEQIHLVTRHINSYFREEFGNKTPFELMTTKEKKKLLSSLELTPIPPAEVLLKPALLK